MTILSNGKPYSIEMCTMIFCSGKSHLINWVLHTSESMEVLRNSFIREERKQSEWNNQLHTGQPTATLTTRCQNCVQGTKYMQEYSEHVRMHRKLRECTDTCKEV